MPSKSARKKGGRSRSKGWKAAQFDSKNKKTTKFGLMVLGFIASIILIGQLINFVSSLYRPLTGGIAVKREYLWDNKFNLNVLIKADQVALMSYNPNEKKITLINIPDQTYLELPKDFGKWRVKAIYPLGEQSNPPVGNLLLEESMESLFGVPIDGYIEFKDKNSDQTPAEALKILRENPLDLLYFYKLKSDLSPWELMQIKYYLPQVRFDKVEVVNLDEVSVLDDKYLPDGSQVLEPDLIKVDDVLTGFVESEVRRENKSIAIFNATSYPGLAQQAARIVKNMGGNVIFTTNSDQKLEKSIVLGEDSITFDRMGQVFSLECLKDKNCDKISDQEVNSSRANINIVLGKDFYNR